MRPRVSVHGRVIILLLGVSAAVSLGILISYPYDHTDATDAGAPAKIPDADAIISITHRSSRPGCEEDNTCYLPAEVRAKRGATILWINEDSAFHSVTSGSYVHPTGDFDSGHIGAGEEFSRTFWESGRQEYFCTLHPWMYGAVIVD